MPRFLKDVLTGPASRQESDEKWDQARAMTAKAQEEGRRAQMKAAEASATQRESAEAMRRAEVARGAEQELQVCMVFMRLRLYSLVR